MRKRKLFAALGHIGFALFAVSCSFRNDAASVSVQIDKQQLQEYLRTINRTGFDCYFITVDGDGITPDINFTDLGGRNPACLGIGVSSSLMSFDDLTTKRTKLRIAAGTNRRVRIMGVNTSAQACAGQALSGIFGTRRPSLYEIASAIENISSDKRIDVKGSLSAAGGDIVPACDNTIVGSGDTKLVASGGVLVTAIANGSDETVRSYQIGSDLIPTSPVNYPSIGGMVSSKLYVTPDGFKLFAVGALGARGHSDRGINLISQRFVPDSDGVFATGPDYQQAFLSLANNMVFSADSKTAYFQSVGLLRQQSIGTKLLMSLGASTACTITYMNSITFSNGFSYFPLSVGVKYLPFPTGGDVCGNLAEPSVNVTSGNTIEGKVHRNGSYYQIANGGSNLSLSAYRPSTDGSWYGPVLGAVTVPSTSTDLYLDREGKFIFVLAGSGTTLSVVPLAADGTIQGIVGPVALPILTNSVAIDPLSRAVYISSPSEVRGYSIAADGALTPLGFSLSPSPGVSFDSLATVPLF